MANLQSAVVRLGTNPRVQKAVAGVAIGTAQSVIAPAAGGFLTELGVTGLGGALTSIGGGTAVATGAATVGAVLAPVAIGAAAIASIWWLCSKN